MFIRQDGNRTRVHTPAKLNLFLEVLGKREDGFHEIETLMVAISRFDTLTLEPLNNSHIELNVHTAGVDVADLPENPTDNLVYRALSLLQQRSGCDNGAVVRLTKRIPPAAGLGGGSSDAAAALLAANRAWRLDRPLDQLQSLAAELGSDIPFFVNRPSGNSATMAICRGRGEVVEPIRAPANMHFVVARPGFGLSTPEVYKRCQPADRSRSADDLLHSFIQGRRAQAAKQMTNRLQPAAESLTPQVADMAREFAALGAIAHQLSGSGSAYFGWFPHAKTARRAAAKLRAKSSFSAWYAHAI